MRNANTADPPSMPQPEARLRPPFWEWGFALLVALLVLSAVWYGFDRFGGRDWDEFETDLTAARHSLLIEHELPFWQPHRLGGHDAFAEPQSAWLSPLGLLCLPFGVPLGCRMFLALAAAAAALGTLRLGAQLGLGGPARSGSAALFALSSPLGLYAAGGIPTFTLGLALLPWLVLCLLRGTPRSLLAGGALLALDLFGGDANHVLYHSLFLGLWALIRTVVTRHARPLRDLVLLLLAAGILATPKLIPAIAFTIEHPRLTTTEEGRGALTPTLLYHVLLDRNAVQLVEAPQREFTAVHREGGLSYGRPLEELDLRTVVDWVNVGTYLGPLALLLALAGLIRLAYSRTNLLAERGPLLALTLAGALLLWIGFGSNVTPSAWELLHRMPAFSSTRSPARMILYPMLCLVLLAGVGLELLATWFERRRERLGLICAAVVVAALVGDVHPPARRAYAQAWVEPDRYQISQRSEQFVQTKGRRFLKSTYYGVPAAALTRAGLGVVNATSKPLPINAAALPRDHPDYRGEAFLLGGGTVVDWRVTSRRVEVEVDLPPGQAATLIVNQNWASGWQVSEPTDAVCRRHDDGRIAVDLPTGTSRMRLTYTSPGFWIGTPIGLAGAALLIAGVRRSERRILNTPGKQES